VTRGSEVARWMVANPVISRGRLLMAQRQLEVALREVSQLVGHLDGGKAGPRYVELGMTEIQSRLLRTVHALDVLPGKKGT
jgi:hypothetical protein